jgi:preprotein translocase subunit SecA
MFDFLKKIFGTQQDRIVKKYRKTVVQVNEWDEKFKSLSKTDIKNKTEEFRSRFKEGESLDDLLPEAYAVVKSACRHLFNTEIHVSGYNQKWDMIPYDVQVLGAIAMHNGAVTEMQTGEGKTLTATMPLYLNAITGKSVHLVTVNDYLAHRDCEWMSCIFEFLGITTAALTNGTPLHERKELYKKDIVYGTASEFGFDYLRDNSSAFSKNDQVQRDYYFAIVDEIDSILIDEARTPLIISGPVPVSRQMYDELKGGVASIVKEQTNLCNRWASESRRVLDRFNLVDENNDTKIESKEDKDRVAEAYRKLWLISKGTPNNGILKRLMENPDIRSKIDGWDLYYYGDQNKAEKAAALTELFIVVDEKASEFELTDKGIGVWAKHAQHSDAADDFVMLDVSEKYIDIDNNQELSAEEKLEKKIEVQEDDEKRKERSHNLRQLFRAQLLMEKDIAYIIQDSKIVIIDENTGRPQPGRRFSDGLHQAIEAKEGVSIQKETQTYATITLQNYFRMYDKLAGMTGTAGTEAGEFKEIYKLQVLEIPTYVTCRRHDDNDEVYMSEREKYNAVLREVKKIHEQGRPILMGTESVNVSEKLSRILRQHNLTHTVLNAKNHGREAEIISLAGQKGAITIATNMAGRGTDIKLGKGVKEAGGLHVIGSSRHHSRRIDRQLRGRAARLGDPGSSKFFVCFEDDLMRLFGSSRWTNLLQKLRPEEGEPISANILNKSIETAQKRVEQRNYMIRKHTLEYDDVMNKHRKEVYSLRNDILHATDVINIACDIIEGLCSRAALQHLESLDEDGEWDREGLRLWLLSHFPVTFEEGCFDDDIDIEDLEIIICNKITTAFKDKVAHEKQKAEETPLPEGMKLKAEVVDGSIRNLMLQTLDRLWQEHLLIMDDLRSDVQMHSVGQRDPLTEFKHEAFSLFDSFIQELRGDIARDLFKLSVEPIQSHTIQHVLKMLQMQGPSSFSMDEFAKEEPKKPEPLHHQEVSEEPKVGRNDPCPCGSGKKYKKCCGV